MSITVRAEFRVAPGDVEAFVGVVAELAEAAAREPGTLRYEWFHGPGPGAFVVLEEYVDDDAALDHNARSPGLLARAHALAEMASLDLHGDVGPALARAAPAARVHRPLRLR